MLHRLPRPIARAPVLAHTSALCALLLAGALSGAASPVQAATSADCPSRDAGITLPPGFCATIFADSPKGSPIGADLTAGKYLWSDGSLAGISKTISDGVATPKQHLGATPLMGGSPLSASDLQAVSAYVWALGHKTGK
jgi:hypothetical protein